MRQKNIFSAPKAQNTTISCVSAFTLCCLFFSCPLLFAETPTYDITGSWTSSVTTIYCSCPGPMITTNSGTFEQGQDETFDMITATGITYSGTVSGNEYSASTTFNDGSTGYIKFKVTSTTTASATYSQYNEQLNCHNETAFSITLQDAVIQNTAPDTPVPVYPGNQSSDIELTPVLEVDDFSDPDSSDNLFQTDWQISTAPRFSTLVLSQSTGSNTLSLRVPFSILSENTAYYWRARFTDTRNAQSQWSEPVFFTTLQTQTDANGNGIPDDLENQTADLNGDGISDIDQTDKIKTLNTLTGEGQMGACADTTSDGTQIEAVNALDPDTLNAFIRPHTMPLGLMTLRLAVDTPGDTASFRIYFSEPAPENASWFIYNSADGWIDYSGNASFSTDRQSVDIKITDGGPGDADGSANGVIADPCGFGIASWLRGKVTDAGNSNGLSQVDISLPGIELYLNTLQDGSYITMLLPGIYDLNFAAYGYQALSMESLSIPEARIIVQDVALTGRCRVTGMAVTGTPSDSSNIKMSVFAESGSESIAYRYSIHNGYGTADYDGNSWYSMTDSEYITDNSCGYSFDTQDKSIVVVWATSSDTNNIDPTGIPIIGWSVDASGAACKINFTGAGISGNQRTNETINFTVNADNTCGNTNYYRYSMCPYYGTNDYDPNNWVSMTSGEWVLTNSIDYTFTEPGKYIVVVWVTDDTDHVNPSDIPIIGWSVDIE